MAADRGNLTGDKEATETLSGTGKAGEKAGRSSWRSIGAIAGVLAGLFFITFAVFSSGLYGEFFKGVAVAFLLGCLFGLGMDSMFSNLARKERRQTRLGHEFPLRIGLSLALLVIIAKAVVWMEAAFRFAGSSNSERLWLHMLLYKEDPSEVWAFAVLQIFSILALVTFTLVLVIAFLRLFRED